MKPIILLAPATIVSRPLGLQDWRLYLFSAILALGNLVVPMALHSIPNAGQIFLPMFFFTLLAAWQFGLFAGLAVAIISPLLNHFLTGMPLAFMLPIVLTKSIALAVVAALLSTRTRSISLPGILLAVAAMQVAGFVAEQLSGFPLARSWTSFQMAIPGMLIMLLAGYLLLRVLNHFLEADPRNEENRR